MAQQPLITSQSHPKNSLQHQVSQSTCKNVVNHCKIDQDLGGTTYHLNVAIKLKYIFWEMILFIFFF